jgi:glycosyltransferase involved in cell wall biosynthesis
VKIVVLCLDAIGPRMAGIAIRSVEIARQLAHHGDVVLAAARRSGEIDLDVPVVSYDRHDGRSVRAHLAGADAVVCQPQWPLVMNELRRCDARLVFDLSCPEIIETLTFRADAQPARRRLITAMTADRLVEALRIGHHFVASTSRQLDLWLGVAAGERLLTPEAYDRDPTLRSRFALAPHGVPEHPARRSDGPGLHGALGLDPAAPVILWTSAIWSWLDAETPIRAMAALRQRMPQARLVFLGADPDRAAGASAHARAKALAAELGLLGDAVLFHEQWLTFDERTDWLLDAACAVSCHDRHLETHFAFRTRYLDCLWAGLPLVVTDGDVLADRIAAADLGATVPERDPAALADALERALTRGRAAYAEQLAAAAHDFAWPRALGDLVAFATATGERPVPLGDDAPRRPGHAARDHGYRAVKGALNAAGVRDWPRGLTGA